MSETSSEPTVTKTSYEATTVAQSGRAHLRHLLFQAGPLLALILLMAYLSFATSNFLTVDNLSNIARQSAFVAIVAVGQTFVILTGGIDLSVAAIAAGVDFPWALWQLLHGRVPPPQDSYRIGSLTQALHGEVDRLFGLARQPKAARRGHSVVGDALRVACMACRPDVNGMLWSWSDPQPAWETATTLSRCWLQTRWRNLVRRRS